MTIASAKNGTFVSVFAVGSRIEVNNNNHNVVRF